MFQWLYRYNYKKTDIEGRITAVITISENNYLPEICVRISHKLIQFSMFICGRHLKFGGNYNFPKAGKYKSQLL